MIWSNKKCSAGLGLMPGRHENQFLQLNAGHSRRFVDALLARPRQPTAALKKAMARYRRQVREA
jgi:hypothetical protein